MKLLTQFNPRWTGLLRPDPGEGIVFDCPKCGPSHSLCAYFSNPLDGKECAAWQKPTWEREGKSFEDLTIRPSIQYRTFLMHYAIPNARVGCVEIAMFAFRCGTCNEDFHIDFTPSFCPKCGVGFLTERAFGEKQ